MSSTIVQTTIHTASQHDSTTYLLYTSIAVVLSYLLYQYGHLFPYVGAFLYMQYHAKHFNKHKKTIPDLFEDRLRMSAKHKAIVFENRSLTFSELNDRSNAVAEWALNTAQLKPRDVVGLMCDNCIEYIVIWLGLAKIGCTTSLINTNLKGDSLYHSFTVIDTKLIITGLSSQCTAAVDEIRHKILENDSSIKFWYIDDTGNGKTTNEYKGFQSLDTVLQQYNIQLGSTDLNKKYKQLRVTSGIKSSDMLFYIYTSGTTGMPKAAKIKHTRMFLAGISFATMHRLNDGDIFYIPMPLYHSAAGMIGVGVSWCTGATIVLRRKFSATAFMKDCAEHKVTIIQYIGQICRYLISTPPSPYDRNHCIKKAIGNGMPQEIWQQFKDRFHIDYIGEFYASTEGNASLINTQNKVGAMGYIPWVATWFYPIRIVRHDYAEEAPVRDKNGRCIDIRAGEIGELINLVSFTDPIRSFDGYTNQKSNDDKLIHDVFKRGDCYFRTGDLVTQDKLGFIYFVDRIGDTFRWKGENCSTSEVQQLLSKFDGFDEINVYGVEVKHNDGRAGMAAVTLTGSNSSVSEDNSDSSVTPGNNKQLTHDDIERKIDMTKLYNFVTKELTFYQQPLFIRFQSAMETTGTFKHRKIDWIKQGYNPSEVDDPLYFKDTLQKRYVRLDKSVYEKIQSGNVRL